jgi:cystathionine beta-lyase/cystathionine gamma-synthase
MSTPSTKILSPLRHSTRAKNIDELVEEQLEHFSIDPGAAYGRALAELTRHLYGSSAAVHELWSITLDTLSQLDRTDRIAYFNAKRFACFQLAKILDTLQNPMRAVYQSLLSSSGSATGKGPYPVFDNVTAIFSATPVITRTATYLYACIEWVEDAFKGKELLLEIYSRLLNPTSISLANHIVDLEAGRFANQYMAWNFNSGMAAIDAVLSHLLGHRDIVLANRNVYGGTYQLLHDWYGKRSNLDIAVEWFDGFAMSDFLMALDRSTLAHQARLAENRQIYVYLESPCNPHGYVLDVPAICREAHARGLIVIVDSTVATPVLQRLLQNSDPRLRPDFLIHSFTKDIAGSGTTTAGTVIGRNERMFIPKGESVTIVGPDGESRVYRWDETLFWNVYYVKGAFLDADKAFEVLSGARTLEPRVLGKSINTIVLAQLLARHPEINVHCNAAPGNFNAPLRERLLHLGLPAPLFTIDFEGASAGPSRVGRTQLKRLFDQLEPAFGLQVSLGQSNTVVLCPALTSHSELSEAALREAGIAPSTIRISVGSEDPRSSLVHLMRASELAIEPDFPGFMAGFPRPDEIDALYRQTYVAVHKRYIGSQPSFDAIVS